MITALINWLRDILLLIAITWMLLNIYIWNIILKIYQNFGKWSFLCDLDFMHNEFRKQMIQILVLVAAITKSIEFYLLIRVLRNMASAIYFYTFI